MKKSDPIHDLSGRRRGWRSVLISIDENTAVASSLVRLARQRNWHLVSLAKFFGQWPTDLTASGAIVSTLPSEPSVRNILDRGIPAVRMGKFPHPEDARVPAVMPHYELVGRLAAEHFAERDFKHVAFVGRKPWGPFESMCDSFRSRAEELGCSFHLLRTALSVNEEPKLSRWQTRQEEFTRWLKRVPAPVGLLAISDRIADRFAYWAMQADLRVPEDFAVMGIGNEEFICECTPIPITSVDFNADVVAESAMNLLDALMAGQNPQQTSIKIPPHRVHSRQSTDVIAASDPMVRQALGYMWDHVHEDLSVRDIAKHVGVGRRTLEIAFKQDLGRGINAEFQRRRLDKARELLLDTDLQIKRIAQLLSFSSQKYFCESFRTRYGVSPSNYRREAESSH